MRRTRWKLKEGGTSSLESSDDETGEMHKLNNLRMEIYDVITFKNSNWHFFLAERSSFIRKDANKCVKMNASRFAVVSVCPCAPNAAGHPKRDSLPAAHGVIVLLVSQGETHIKGPLCII